MFWHSSAHLLGESLEHNYGALLTIGPPVAGGFYYDSYLGDDSLSEGQFGEIEDEVREVVKHNEAFWWLVITKDEALDLFKYSPFKTALIEAKVPVGTPTPCTGTAISSIYPQHPQPQMVGAVRPRAAPHLLVLSCLRGVLVFHYKRP